MYSVRSLLFWRKGCCRGGELIRNKPIHTLATKNQAGEISKNMQRVFLAGRVPALLEQAAGLGLAFTLEVGSCQLVKLHHFGKRTEIVALLGDFFFGCAERKPADFLGGGNFGALAS